MKKAMTDLFLSKFKIFLLFFLTHSVYCSEKQQVNIVYVDDSFLLLKYAARHVENYNRESTNIHISLTPIYCGHNLTLSDLDGKHLVWCDISMPRENGDQTLARLKKEAEETEFFLPPFIASTSEDDYLGEQYARKNGFLFGYGKVKKEDIDPIFKKCEEKLNDN